MHDPGKPELGEFVERRTGLTGTPRVAAAISAGVVPAIVAFVVLLVIDGDWVAALVTAMIVWAALAAVMWVRFGRPQRVSRRKGSLR